MSVGATRGGHTARPIIAQLDVHAAFTTCALTAAHLARLSLKFDHSSSQRPAGCAGDMREATVGAVRVRRAEAVVARAYEVAQPHVGHAP